ncbi:MAG: class II fructose-bisphosphate aldolase [Clostridia bacterium]|jgi:fructose/tagatose bisphosphate aldolase
MPIITDREQVLGIYREAESSRWVLPCLCTENLTTTEAILEAAREYGDEKGIPDLPIIVAITNLYSHRAQSTFYTHTHRWDIGIKLFLEDLRILTEKGSPYKKLRVMVHLDHIQFDEDRELLSWDMGAFSSIMFDASKLPLQENIRLTRQFVEEQGNKIVVEGACDEIADAGGEIRNELTTAEEAWAYLEGTGVDLIVANLGTEHRASGKELKYYGDQARKIKERIGNRIVLHGTSSVPDDQIAQLIDDGVCKVNIWTTLERDSSPVLFRSMVENASKVAGRSVVEELKQAGYLGPKCSSQDAASLDFFTTAYRQQIVFHEMKKLVRKYLELWYR